LHIATHYYTEIQQHTITPKLKSSPNLLRSRGSFVKGALKFFVLSQILLRPESM